MNRTENARPLARYSSVCFMPSLDRNQRTCRNGVVISQSCTTQKHTRKPMKNKRDRIAETGQRPTNLQHRHHIHSVCGLDDVQTGTIRHWKNDVMDQHHEGSLHFPINGQLPVHSKPQVNRGHVLKPSDTSLCSHGWSPLGKTLTLVECRNAEVVSNRSGCREHQEKRRQQIGKRPEPSSEETRDVIRSRVRGNAE
jgi:hypothetical protein